MISNPAKRSFLLCMFLSFCFQLVTAWGIESDENSRKAFIIPISGAVDPGMAAFVARAQRKAAEYPNALVVLDIDTFGGRVDAALEIVDTMLKLPKARTVAYVAPNAISAGALIALSCGRLAMAPGSTIGDVAPIMQSSEGPKMLGEKFQSPLRAKFRALAERNGYPVALVEAMVTKEKEVLQIRLTSGEIRYLDARQYEELSPADKENVIAKTTVVEPGELLTLHAAEAREYGLSMLTADSIDDLLDRIGPADAQPILIEENWSETLVRLIDRFAPVLMMIGLAGLYIEIKSPGFGVPGAVGLACLALVFFSQYAAGLADYTELLILIAGILLMGMEVFVLPGFGLAGFAGMALIVAGMILAMQNFVLPNPSLPWQQGILIDNVIRVLGAYLSAMILGLLFIRFVMPRIPSNREGPYLTASLKDAHADVPETRMARVGEHGVALTLLRPSGKAEFGGRMLDVITDGEYVAQATPIVIVAIHGNRIIVSPRDNT